VADWGKMLSLSLFSGWLMQVRQIKAFTHRDVFHQIHQYRSHCLNDDADMTA
jgi:hypothetical protein